MSVSFAAKIMVAAAARENLFSNHVFPHLVRSIGVSFESEFGRRKGRASAHNGQIPARGKNVRNLVADSLVLPAKWRLAGVCCLYERFRTGQVASTNAAAITP